MIRYSPKPLSDYKRTINHRELGPATSALIDTPETWNLAYLSYDFESRLDHPDPQFTTNVRRTCQSKLDGSGFDLTQSQASPHLLGSMLSLPAPRFVHLIRQHSALTTFPMYTAYGEKWLETMEERARFCQSEGDNDFSTEDLRDMQEARDLLSRIRSSS